MAKQQTTPVYLTVFSVLAVLIMIAALAWAIPQYNVWAKELDGKAELRKAEWNRQIAVEEARALKESAALQAEAEIARAKGVAEANKIIGDSLKENEAYLRYLWIDKLGDQDVIYIPTEAGIPILEAGRTVGE